MKVTNLGIAWSSASGRPGHGPHHPGRTRSRCGPSGVDERCVMNGTARHGFPRFTAAALGQQSPKVVVTLTDRHHERKDPGSTAPGPFPRHTHGGRPWLGLLELAQHRVAGE
jgi:hypothetical protein